MKVLLLSKGKFNKNKSIPVRVLSKKNKKKKFI